MYRSAVCYDADSRFVKTVYPDGCSSEITKFTRDGIATRGYFPSINYPPSQKCLCSFLSADEINYINKNLSKFKIDKDENIVNTNFS